MRIIDITKELLSCPVYEGDPIPRKRRVSDVESGGYMLTELTLGSHSGTHVDAPCHFIEGGEDISQVKIEKCIGKCAVCRTA